MRWLTQLTCSSGQETISSLREDFPALLSPKLDGSDGGGPPSVPESDHDHSEVWRQVIHIYDKGSYERNNGTSQEVRMDGRTILNIDDKKGRVTAMCHNGPFGLLLIAFASGQITLYTRPRGDPGAPDREMRQGSYEPAAMTETRMYITTAAFSPDGKQVVLATKTGAILALSCPDLRYQHSVAIPPPARWPGGLAPSKVQGAWRLSLTEASDTKDDSPRLRKVHSAVHTANALVNGDYLPVEVNYVKEGYDAAAPAAVVVGAAGDQEVIQAEEPTAVPADDVEDDADWPAAIHWYNGSEASRTRRTLAVLFRSGKGMLLSDTLDTSPALFDSKTFIGASHSAAWTDDGEVLVVLGQRKEQTWMDICAFTRAGDPAGCASVEAMSGGKRRAPPQVLGTIPSIPCPEGRAWGGSTVAVVILERVESESSGYDYGYNSRYDSYGYHEYHGGGGRPEGCCKHSALTMEFVNAAGEAKAAGFPITLRAPASTDTPVVVGWDGQNESPPLALASMAGARCVAGNGAVLVVGCGPDSGGSDGSAVIQWLGDASRKPETVPLKNLTPVAIAVQGTEVLTMACCDHTGQVAIISIPKSGPPSKPVMVSPGKGTSPKQISCKYSQSVPPSPLKGMPVTLAGYSANGSAGFVSVQHKQILKIDRDAKGNWVTSAFLPPEGMVPYEARPSRTGAWVALMMVHGCLLWWTKNDLSVYIPNVRAWCWDESVDSAAAVCMTAIRHRLFEVYDGMERGLCTSLCLVGAPSVQGPSVIMTSITKPNSVRPFSRLSSLKDGILTARYQVQSGWPAATVHNLYERILDVDKTPWFHWAVLREYFRRASDKGRVDAFDKSFVMMMLHSRHQEHSRYDRWDSHRRGLDPHEQIGSGQFDIIDDRSTVSCYADLPCMVRVNYELSKQNEINMLVSPDEAYDLPLEPQSWILAAIAITAEFQGRVPSRLLTDCFIIFNINAEHHSDAFPSYGRVNPESHGGPGRKGIHYFRAQEDNVIALPDKLANEWLSVEALLRDVRDTLRSFWGDYGTEVTPVQGRAYTTFVKEIESALAGEDMDGGTSYWVMKFCPCSDAEDPPPDPSATKFAKLFSAAARKGLKAGLSVHAPVIGTRSCIDEAWQMLEWRRESTTALVGDGSKFGYKNHFEYIMQAQNPFVHRWSLLAFATLIRDTELMSILLKSGADPNGSSHFEVPPLALASSEKSRVILLEAGADPFMMRFALGGGRDLFMGCEDGWFNLKHSPQASLLPGLRGANSDENDHIVATSFSTAMQKFDNGTGPDIRPAAPRLTTELLYAALGTSLEAFYKDPSSFQSKRFRLMTHLANPSEWGTRHRLGDLMDILGEGFVNIDTKGTLLTSYSSEPDVLTSHYQKDEMISVIASPQFDRHSGLLGNVLYEDDKDSEYIADIEAVTSCSPLSRLRFASISSDCIRIEPSCMSSATSICSLEGGGEALNVNAEGIAEETDDTKPDRTDMLVKNFKTLLAWCGVPLTVCDSEGNGLLHHFPVHIARGSKVHASQLGKLLGLLQREGCDVTATNHKGDSALAVILRGLSGSNQNPSAGEQELMLLAVKACGDNPAAFFDTPKAPNFTRRKGMSPAMTLLSRKSGGEMQVYALEAMFSQCTFTEEHGDMLFTMLRGAASRGRVGVCLAILDAIEKVPALWDSRSQRLTSRDDSFVYCIGTRGELNGGVEEQQMKKLADVLRRCGVPFDHCTRLGWPLLYHFNAGRVDVCVAMIQAGYSVKATDDDGRTPLHKLALMDTSGSLDGEGGCWGRFTPLVDVLVKVEGGLTSTDSAGNTPLHLHAQQPTTTDERTRSLFCPEAASTRNDAGDTPLLVAAKVGNTVVCEQLAEMVESSVLMETDLAGRHFLHCLVMNTVGFTWSGSQEAWPTALKTKDKNGNTVIHYIQAYTEGGILDRYAEVTLSCHMTVPNSQGITPLHVFFQYAPATVFEQRCGVVKAHVPSVSEALRMKDKDGVTPFMAAVCYGVTTMEFGSDAWKEAYLKRVTEVVSWLRQSGGDESLAQALSQADNAGNTVVTMAVSISARSGDTDVVTLLREGLPDGSPESVESQRPSTSQSRPSSARARKDHDRVKADYVEYLGYVTARGEPGRQLLSEPEATDGEGIRSLREELQKLRLMVSTHVSETDADHAGDVTGMNIHDLPLAHLKSRWRADEMIRSGQGHMFEIRVPGCEERTVFAPTVSISSSSRMSEILEMGRIPLDDWGQGKAKSVESLVKEVNAKQSVICMHSGIVFRLTHVVSALVTRREWHDESMSQMALVQTYEMKTSTSSDSKQTSDVSFRRRGEPPSKRLHSCLTTTPDIRVAAAVCLAKELNTSLSSIVIENSPVRQRTVWRESPSYPGLLSCYVVYELDAVVSSLPASPFCTHEPPKTHFWDWMTREVALQSTATMAACGNNAVAPANDSFLVPSLWAKVSDAPPSLKDQMASLLAQLCGPGQYMIRTLVGGKSGASVVQIKGVDPSGRPTLPRIGKFDIVSKLKDECDKHMMMMTVLEEAIPKLIEYSRVHPKSKPDQDIGGMVMELAGARWYLPELSPVCRVVELHDMFLEDIGHRSSDSPSRSSGGVTVQSVLNYVLGHLLFPRHRRVTTMNPFKCGKVDVVAAIDGCVLGNKGKRKPTADIAGYMKNEGKANAGSIQKLAEFVRSAKTPPAVESMQSTQHGDLNLHNILICSQSSVWLIDFAHSSEFAPVFLDAAKVLTVLLIEAVPIPEESLQAAFNLVDFVFDTPDPLVSRNLSCDDVYSATHTSHISSVLKWAASYAQVNSPGDPSALRAQFWTCCLYHLARTLAYTDVDYTNKRVSLRAAAHCARRLLWWSGVDGALNANDPAKVAEENSNEIPTSLFSEDEFLVHQTSQFFKQNIHMHGTIFDPMSGSKLDILSQCTSVHMMEPSLKSRAVSTGHMVINEVETAVARMGSKGTASLRSAVHFLLNQKVHSLNNDERHLLVIGHPAAGKTVLLKQLFLLASMGGRVAGNRGRESAHRLPVLVILVELVRMVDEARVPWEHADILDIYISNKYGEDSGNTRLIRHMRSRGLLLLLLDGLDEVRDTSLERVMLSVSGFKQEGHLLVVTTRPTNWNVVMKWFSAWQWAVILKLSNAMQESMARSRLGPLHRPFLAEVRDRTDFETLMESPLLLSLLMHIYTINYERQGPSGNTGKSDTAMIPKNPAALYDACIKSLISHLDRVKKLEGGDLDSMMVMLRNLAHHLHCGKESGVRDFGPDTAISVVEKYKTPKGSPPITKTTWTDLQAAVHKGRIPLLVCVSADPTKTIFRFSHLTFQEYLAADYITSEIQALLPKPNMITTDPKAPWRVTLSGADPKTIAATMAIVAKYMDGLLLRHRGDEPQKESFDWFKQLLKFLSSSVSDNAFPFLAYYLLEKTGFAAKHDEPDYMPSPLGSVAGEVLGSILEVRPGAIDVLAALASKLPSAKLDPPAMTKYFHAILAGSFEKSDTLQERSSDVMKSLDGLIKGNGTSRIMMFAFDDLKFFMGHGPYRVVATPAAKPAAATKKKPVPKSNDKKSESKKDSPPSSRTVVDAKNTLYHLLFSESERTALTKIVDDFGDFGPPKLCQESVDGDSVPYFLACVSAMADTMRAPTKDMPRYDVSSLNLKTAELSGSNFGSVLSNIPKLTVLTLQECHLVDSDLPALNSVIQNNSGTLRRMSLSKNSFSSPDSTIKGLPSLLETKERVALDLDWDGESESSQLDSFTGMVSIFSSWRKDGVLGRSPRFLLKKNDIGADDHPVLVLAFTESARLGEDLYARILCPVFLGKIADSSVTLRVPGSADKVAPFDRFLAAAVAQMREEVKTIVFYNSQGYEHVKGRISEVLQQVARLGLEQPPSTTIVVTGIQDNRSYRKKSYGYVNPYHGPKDDGYGHAPQPQQQSPYDYGYPPQYQRSYSWGNPLQEQQPYGYGDPIVGLGGYPPEQPQQPYGYQGYLTQGQLVLQSKEESDGYGYAKGEHDNVNSDAPPEVELPDGNSDGEEWSDDENALETLGRAGTSPDVVYVKIKGYDGKEELYDIHAQLDVLLESLPVLIAERHIDFSTAFVMIRQGSETRVVMWSQSFCPVGNQTSENNDGEFLVMCRPAECTIRVCNALADIADSHPRALFSKSELPHPSLEGHTVIVVKAARISRAHGLVPWKTSSGPITLTLGTADVPPALDYDHYGLRHQAEMDMPGTGTGGVIWVLMGMILGFIPHSGSEGKIYMCKALRLGHDYSCSNVASQSEATWLRKIARLTAMLALWCKRSTTACKRVEGVLDVDPGKDKVMEACIDTLKLKHHRLRETGKARELAEMCVKKHLPALKSLKAPSSRKEVNISEPLGSAGPVAYYCLALVTACGVMLEDTGGSSEVEMVMRALSVHIQKVSNPQLRKELTARGAVIVESLGGNSGGLGATNDMINIAFTSDPDVLFAGLKQSRHVSSALDEFVARASSFRPSAHEMRLMNEYPRVGSHAINGYDDMHQAISSGYDSVNFTSRRFRSSFGDLNIAQAAEVTVPSLPMLV